MNLEELDLKARPGAFSTYDMEVLVPEVQLLKAGQIYLEVGVDKGKSLSVARMVADKGVEVYGVDVREDPEVAGTNFIHKRSDLAAKQWKGTVDVLFIDGDHSYEGCKTDIDSWYPHMAEHGVMLFHDCDRSSPGVVKAVHEFADKLGVEPTEYTYITPNEKCSMAVIRL